MRGQKRPRRATQGFRIIDGLVATAVTAVGLAWARGYWAETIASIPGRSWTRIPHPRWWIAGDPFYRSARDLVLVGFYVGTTLAASWGVALVILRRVRRPGSPFWRARRPGAQACLASSVVLGLTLAFQSVWPSSQWIVRDLVGPDSEIRALATFSHHDFWWGDPNNIDPFLNTALQMPRWAGFVVAGAWIALALSGRWRAERSWIDRLGRVIGVFWIVAALHFLFFPL